MRAKAASRSTGQVPWRPSLRCRPWRSSRSIPPDVRGGASRGWWVELSGACVTCWWIGRSLDIGSAASMTSKPCFAIATFSARTGWTSTGTAHRRLSATPGRLRVCDGPATPRRGVLADPRASRCDRAPRGYLFHCLQDRCPARLGPGARSVALTAAAHAWSCGSHSACAGRASPMGGERLKRGLPSSK
jgi:hypothetical protein